MISDGSAAHVSLSFRLSCVLVGVDPTLMAEGPPRDRDGVSLLCAMMVLVWLWQTLVFAAVAHLMLAQPGEIRPVLIGAAALLATIILMIDAYVVMRPSWTSLGQEELRRGGLALPLPLAARIKGDVFLAARLGLSLVIGTLVAVFVTLLLYGKDISTQLAADQAVRNAGMIAAQTALFDRRLARNLENQAAARAQVTAAEVAANALRLGSPAPVDAGVANAQAELTRTERRRQRTEDELARAGRRADEVALTRARLRVEAATHERDEAQTRLAQAQTRAITLQQERGTTVANHLAAIDAQRNQALARLTALEDEQRRWSENRSALIQTAVEADPAFVPANDGLLARIRALKALTADPWTFTVVLLLEVFFAGVELAAVLAKLLSFIPTTYATRLVREDQLRQIGTAREVAAAMDNQSDQMMDVNAD